MGKWGDAVALIAGKVSHSKIGTGGREGIDKNIGIRTGGGLCGHGAHAWRVWTDFEEGDAHGGGHAVGRWRLVHLGQRS